MASWDKSKFMLSQNFAFEACGLIYRRWSTEFDLLKQCKAERDDGSPDWKQMHDLRLKHHTQEEAKWKRLSDEAATINSRMMNGKDCENID